MIGDDWQESSHPCHRLRDFEKHTTLRKVRLIAAAFARWLEPQLVSARTRPTADVLEAVADAPELVDVDRFEWRIRRHDWMRINLLSSDQLHTGQAFRKLVVFSPSYLGRETEQFNFDDDCFRRANELIAEVIGPADEPIPFLSEWRTPTAVALATAIYADRAFDRLPVLADALEEAGCDHPDVLAHSRGPGPHVCGCWVVDLVLGKS